MASMSNADLSQIRALSLHQKDSRNSQGISESGKAVGNEGPPLLKDAVSHGKLRQCEQIWSWL